jgi:uncharacterized protein
VIRVVVDTSVLIRYLIKPGSAVRAMIEQYWVDGAFVMVTAPELLAELRAVLARPAMSELVRADEAAVLVAAVRDRAEMISPLGEVPVYTRDRKDDVFVACAVAGRADCIVTADNDILVLERLLEVRMVTPQQFVTIVAGGGEPEHA